MTPSERKERFDALARIGCIVCRVYMQTWSEPHIHHLQGIKYRAMGKKADDKFSIPLCPAHHQHGRPSVHGNPKEFADTFGTQEELLEMTNKMIEAAK